MKGKNLSEIQLVIDYLDLQKIHFTEFKTKSKYLKQLIEVTPTYDVENVLKMYKEGSFLSFIEHNAKIDPRTEIILNNHKKRILNEG